MQLILNQFMHSPRISHLQAALSTEVLEGDEWMGIDLRTPSDVAYNHAQDLILDAAETTNFHGPI